MFLCGVLVRRWSVVIADVLRDPEPQTAHFAALNINVRWDDDAYVADDIATAGPSLRALAKQPSVPHDALGCFACVRTDGSPVRRRRPGPNCHGRHDDGQLAPISVYLPRPRPLPGNVGRAAGTAPPYLTSPSARCTASRNSRPCSTPAAQGHRRCRGRCGSWRRRSGRPGPTGSAVSGHPTAGDNAST